MKSRKLAFLASLLAVLLVLSGITATSAIASEAVPVIEDSAVEEGVAEEAPLVEELSEPEPVAEEEEAPVAAASKSGWLREDGQDFYYDPETGKKLKGPAIVEIEGELYCLSAKGAALSGLRSVDKGASYYLFSEAGEEPGQAFALSGLQGYRGKTYYADPATHALASGRKTVEGKTYLFDGAKGAALTGWQNVAGANCYFDPEDNGAMVKGPAVRQIGDKLFCFSAKGAALSGLRSVDGGKTRYLFASSEEPGGSFALSGWQTYRGKTCYFDPETNAMVRGKTVTIDGAKYKFDANGTLVSSGKVKINDKWYWYDNGAKRKTRGWFKNNGTWYFVKSNYALATKWEKIKGSWYLFDSEARMLTGWQKVDGKWYYLESSGAMATGWIKVGGLDYCLNASGALYENTRTPDGYYVDKNGVWDTVNKPYSGGGSKTWEQASGASRQGLIDSLNRNRNRYVGTPYRSSPCGVPGKGMHCAGFVSTALYEAGYANKFVNGTSSSYNYWNHGKVYKDNISLYNNDNTWHTQGFLYWGLSNKVKWVGYQDHAAAVAGFKRGEYNQGDLIFYTYGTPRLRAGLGLEHAAIFWGSPSAGWLVWESMPGGNYIRSKSTCGGSIIVFTTADV